MSRSRIYRSVHLTDDQRAELARLCREARSRVAIPRLRSHLQAELALISTGDVAGVGRLELSALHRRVENLDAVDDLRELAIKIDRVGGERNDGVAHRRPQLARGSLLTSASNGSPDTRPASALRFDATWLRAELDSIESTAAELGVESTELATSRAALAQTDLLVSSASWAAARDALIRAERLCATVDDRVTVALAAAECRARTVEAAKGSLARMGYQVEDFVVDADGTRLVGAARDGRRAEIDVTGDGDLLEVSSSFTDPGSAVSPTHADSAEVCEAAVRDQFDFTRSLADHSGLKTGRPVTDERPTRGSIVPGGRRSRRPRGFITDQQRKRRTR